MATGVVRLHYRQCIVAFSKVFFYLSSYLLFLSFYRSFPLYCWYVGLSFSALAVCLGMFRIREGFFLLGFSFCVLPFFGQGEVSCVLVSFLLGAAFSREVKREHIKGFLENRSVWDVFLPLLVLYLLASVNTLLNHANWPILIDTLRVAGLKALYRYISINPVLEQRAIAESVGIILATILAFRVMSMGETVEKVLRPVASGLALGFLVSSLVAFCQILDLHPFFRLNLSPFWVEMKRVSGTFSDPNSFALMGVLALPVLCVYAVEIRDVRLRWFWRISIAVTIFALLFSGSRTLVLGLVVWALLSFFFRVRAQPKVVLISFVFASVLVFVVSFPSVNESLRAAIPVSTVQRVLHSADSRNVGTAFASRTVFWRLALAAALENPIVGLGLGRFIETQEHFVAVTGVELGAWRDNANNYYLAILSEAGLCGLVLLLICIYFIASHLRRRVTIASSRLIRTLRGALVVFLIMLMTGPHFYFEEVRYLIFLFVGVVLSQTGTETYRRSRLERFLLLIVFVLSIVMAGSILVQSSLAPTKVRGFYPQEVNGADVTRWSVANSQLGLNFDEHGVSELWVRAIHPDILQSPVTVSSEFRGVTGLPPLGRSLLAPSAVLGDTDWHRLEFHGPASACVAIGMRVDRLWSPSQYSSGWVDRRYLGVAVRWTPRICGES